MNVVITGGHDAANSKAAPIERGESMRRLMIGLGVTAAVAGLLATGQPVLAEPPAPPQAPSRAFPEAPAEYAGQRIQWQPCFPPGQPLPPGLPPGSERIECGELTAPRDWHDPAGGEDVTIAVTRLSPASGPAGRALFTNPGGPGGAGVEMPLAMLVQNHTRVLENFDIYGIDVRGTGLSSTVSCGPQDATDPLDARDRSPQSIRAQLALTEEFAADCQRHSGELGRYVTTEQTVADLDLLRQVEQREKVNWYGVSGGTWLGAYYATYFPEAVDKFVLDSNAQFTGSWQEVFGWQPLAFERRWREDLRPWLAAHDDVYGLGATPDAVQKTVDELRAELKRNPVPNPEGAPLDHNAFDSMLLWTMYSKQAFPSLGEALAGLRGGTAPQREDAARTMARADAMALPMRPTPVADGQDPVLDSQTATMFSIRCNDTRFRGGPGDLVWNSELQGRLFPTYGYNTIFQPCAYWDRPDVELREPTGEGVPPVLMLQSENDPATAVEGARIAHRDFAGSRMVTVADEGDHGVYAAGNACVDDVVESYLVDGVVPARDVTCQGVGLPEPQQARTAAAKPAGLLDVLAELADTLG
ncbi:alpha/beta hydrolase [Saccharopolyspora erythraea]|uniref:alpha/beta hydrolase n=1 Tax=Saccharopolyspora erythraea TaxID=1836 RepID=UPI0020113457|nr:alpha/beta hydrolase [Saccharopolyspora erythraea]